MSTQPVPGGPAPDISQTTLSFAQQSQLAASIANAFHSNANNQIIYDGAVRDYNANMEEGVKHNPPLKPPIAPAKIIVLPPDAEGMQYWGPSTTEFLTPTPPLQLDTTDLGSLSSLTPSTAPQGVFMGIGKQIGGASSKWFDANYGDTIPGGMPAPPQADGHEYLKFGSPVGWGWWLQTS